MASPAPLLRPPIPGGAKTQSGNKVPRLGLSIPASPNQRPVNSSAAPPMTDASALPPLDIPNRQPPKLNLATPMGSNQPPQEGSQPRRRGPPLIVPASGGSSDESARSRTNSFGGASSNQNGSISTTSSLSAVNFADIIGGSKEPGSAYSSSSAADMERGDSTQGLEVDLEQLSLEKGRALDVQDLDDMGWKAAKREGRIEELGSLGEGAGGAVTKCRLKGGKTVFALKVSEDVIPCHHAA